MCYFLCVDQLFKCVENQYIITLENLDFEPLLFSIRCLLVTIPRLTTLLQAPLYSGTVQSAR